MLIGSLGIDVERLVSFSLNNLVNHSTHVPSSLTDTCAACSVVVILIELFHLSSAWWAILRGRNTELDKLSVHLQLTSVCVRATALPVHAALLCLFYFVSCINDEAPGGSEWGTQPSLGKCAHHWVSVPDRKGWWHANGGGSLNKGLYEIIQHSEAHIGLRVITISTQIHLTSHYFTFFYRQKRKRGHGTEINVLRKTTSIKNGVTWPW